MLVQFKMKNVLSFRDETVFDMRAVNSYKEHPYNLIENKGKEKLLKIAAVYGANASGKTNLYRAIHYFSILVHNSANSANAIENKEKNTSILKDYYKPFSFDLDASSEDSMFEVVIEKDGCEYTYGFEYNGERVSHEWAYKRSLDAGRKRQSVILERKEEKLEFGASIRGRYNRYKDLIKEDALVLSFLGNAEKGVEDEATGFFGELLDVIGTISPLPAGLLEKKDFLEDIIPAIVDDPNEKKELIAYIKALDFGIKDILYQKEGKEIKLYTVHVGKDGNDYELNLFNESEGTLKCIALYINISIAIWGNSTIVIDELDAKLHPLMLKNVLDYFHGSDSEAQLIYTTHDVTFLNREYFRRDQIWFVEKDEYGQTFLNAMSDYKLRSDASFAKDYLGGAYGAIPHLGDYRFGSEEK